MSNQRTWRSQFSFLIHFERLAFTTKLFRRLKLCWNRQKSSSPSSSTSQYWAQPKTVWIYTYSHGIFRGSLKSNTSGLPKPPSTGCQGWGALLHLQVWARPQAFHQVATHLKKSQWLTSLSRALRFGIKGSINKINKCEKVGMSSFSCWTWQDQDNYEKAILSKLEREDVFSFFRTMIQSEQ